MDPIYYYKNLFTITDQIKRKQDAKNRNLFYYIQVLRLQCLPSFRSKQTVNKQLDITTVTVKRSRIWTPTVEDEQALRVRSEHPRRMTVRRVLPVKNGKNPSVTGGLKETLGLSQQEAPFLLHCGHTHGNPRVSRHRRAG
ncbi:hypothetical protein M9H77_28228 [Catharanthus roseus]|uniref:Uncharacterized protein n=1 Tax=Catharanthus roseus TaxID=4058 RepID=A0ACC0AGM8_CATRO|nr:hypothetical protein M9H77_28228 [Catharanthus roseus]